MKKVYATLLITMLIASTTFAQPNTNNITSFGEVDFSPIEMNRAPGDSCGAYFNNYIGLSKLTVANVQYIRSGNAIEDTWGGLCVRYHCPQPMEVSGLKFYAYDTSSAVDSVMVIAILNDWDDVLDSLGVELARDTVYVKHQAFSYQAEQIAVVATFNNPVVVTEDYMVSIIPATDDSLGVMVSAPANNDGQGEGITYYIYNNPAYPSFHGSYNELVWTNFDYDPVISPLVKYQLQNNFTIQDDHICPNVVSAGCVNHTQMPVFSDPHYSSNAGAPTTNLLWTWGDGLQNTQLLTACHTYTTADTFDITLSDNFERFDAINSECPYSISQPIYVLDGATADFTWLNNNTWITFTNTSTNADSVLWDFGDSTYSTVWDAFHIYDSVATYDVTLIAYGECGNDTTVISVTTDDVGIEDYDFNFSCYPNPANNQVTITGLLEGTTIDLVNILGEIVQRNVSTGTSLNLSTTDLSNGTYFVRVSTDYGQVTKKLMIRH